MAAPVSVSRKLIEHFPSKFMLKSHFLVVDMEALKRLFVREQIMQMCHSLRCKLLDERYEFYCFGDLSVTTAQLARSKNC